MPDNPRARGFVPDFVKLQGLIDKGVTKINAYNSLYPRRTLASTKSVKYYEKKYGVVLKRNRRFTLATPKELDIFETIIKNELSDVVSVDLVRRKTHWSDIYARKMIRKFGKIPENGYGEVVNKKTTYKTPGEKIVSDALTSKGKLFKLFSLGADFLLLNEEANILVEVKTSLNNSGQIYKGMIQLLYAKSRIEHIYNIEINRLWLLYERGPETNDGYQRYTREFNVTMKSVKELTDNSK